ncbi:MAG: PaaI family thioesterase [Spirochaetales bacterium]|nr:PaaI family thioesterase [Spirochaetales bacterium]
MKKFLPTYTGCILCGDKKRNPFSLGLKFYVTDDGVESKIVIPYQYQGYEGVVHGGITSALLDEAIGWAVAVSRKRYFVTAELNVRFVKPLLTDQKIAIRAKAINHKGLISLGEGEIIDEKGIVLASGKAKFFLLDKEKSRDVDSYLSYGDEDLSFLDDF